MKTILLGLWLGLATLTLHAAEGDQILGLWNTAENKGQVEIFKRGDTYAAKIVRLTEPNYPPDDKKGMGGQPRIDRENPKPELRNRPVVGLEIMEQLTYAGNQRWDHGRIYDPESGNTYRCKMHLTASNRLEMRGFIGISLLGRSTVWTR